MRISDWSSDVCSSDLIAKHASLTRFRDLTAEKREWGENWLKPRDSRYISILVGNDAHDIECSPFWRKCFVVDRIEVETGDITKLPFPDASFNVVVSMTVIHNIPSREGRDQALRELVREIGRAHV